METLNPEHGDDRRISRECLSLIQSAHINIYRENTFRITGLSVDASEKEIKKHADKLKIMEELGHGQGANPAAFVLDPPPSVDQIRGAIQRLKEPEHRLVDEFFWFWPQEFGKSASDSAIQAILAGDSATAYDIWSRLESSPEHGYIAWHNIAVMFHLIALDWTLYHISSELDQGREQKIKGYWKESFSRWEKVATDDRVWDAVKNRIRAVDDPRLTTGFARRMRDTFPQALDKINAEVALQFAEQGLTDWAEIHIDFMNETHQGLDDVDKTAELVLTPTRNRVLQHIKTAKEECEKKPEKGAEVARNLIEQCHPLQGLFELFHGSDSHHKTELFDDVATTLNVCLVQYSNKTADFSENILLLREALQFATSIDIRQVIQRNISIGEGKVRGKELEPFFTKLKEIQDSAETAKSRLGKIKDIMMPYLADLVEKEGPESESVAELSESYAIVLRGISIDAHNSEKDYLTAVEAIRLASKLATSTDQKKRIADDLRIVEEHLRDATCYYCGKNMAQPSCACEIPMFGDVERHWGKVSYRHTKIVVPRCVSCSASHSKQSKISGAIWIVFLLLGIGIGAASGEAGWLVGGFIGCFVGWIISAITEKVMRSSSGLKSPNDYPRIRELRLTGWEYGEKPGR